MSLKFNGIGASAGIGIGTVVVVKEPSLEYKRVKISNPESEIARLQEGLDKTISQTSDMAADMKKRVGEKEAEILEGHMLLLMDPAMTGEMEDEIKNESKCAEQAVEEICEKYAALFASLDDPMFQQRATDVNDIKTRLLKNLLGVEDINLVRAFFDTFFKAFSKGFLTLHFDIGIIIIFSCQHIDHLTSFS